MASVAGVTATLCRLAQDRRGSAYASYFRALDAVNSWRAGLEALNNVPQKQIHV